MNDATESLPPKNDDAPEAPAAEKEKPASSADQLREISRLLRGDPEPEETTDDAPEVDADQDAPPTREKPKKPSTLDDIAAALKLDPAALYDIEIPLRKGQPERIKLGELKDYYAADDEHRLERVRWEEKRSQDQAEIARTRAEINELLRVVPQDKLNKDVLDAVRKKVDATVAAERRKTLAAIPEWNDDEKRVADLSGIAEHLADFGIPADTLQSITDHRILAYMRDNWARKRRLEQALEKVQAVRPATHPKSGQARKAPSSPVRNSEGARTVSRKVDAVSRLLRGK